MEEELHKSLAEIGPRAIGSDAERRAHRVLARTLRRHGVRSRTEPVWVRPRHAAGLAIACALGVAGSVVSADHPQTGLYIAIAALVLGLGEATGLLPLPRLLTRERCTQDVVVRIPARDEARDRVVVLARVDSSRGGVLTRWHIPFPPVAACTLLGIVVAFAAARVAEVDNQDALGAVQLVPTVALILLVGGFLDEAFASPGPGDARGASVAAAAAVKLDKIAPRHLDVAFVLGRPRKRVDKRTVVIDVDALVSPSVDLVLGLIRKLDA